MEREEGRGVDNGLDSRRGVGNGLDRDRVDVVVDDRAPTRTQTDNRNGRGNSETTIKHSIECSSGTRTINCYYHGHDMYRGSASNMTNMSDAGDNK